MAKNPCVYTLNGKTYSEAEFKAHILEGNLDDVLGGYFAPKETGKKEDLGFSVNKKPIKMPDGEAGFSVSITKPNGEKVDVGNMYPEDVQRETDKIIRGMKLQGKQPSTTTTTDVKANTADFKDKTVSFTHAGNKEKGRVVGSDTKGNLKIKGADGLNYTVPKENISEAYQTEKVYEDIAGLQPNTTAGRIPVAPITGKSPKQISDIIFDVTKEAKQRVLYAKQSRRKALGSYNAGNSAIKIKFNNDLDTTAHELGHSIDDNFGLLSELETTSNVPVESELLKFAPYGSTPPKGHPNPRMYQLGEGFAEWLRAYIVNPDAAKQDASNTYALYESKVSDGYKKAVDAFSEDIRTFAGASGRDMVLSNMQWKPKEGKGIIGEIFDRSDNGNMYSINWSDKLAAKFINPFRAFNKAVDYLKGIKGIDTLLPAENPELLSRALLHIDEKLNVILQGGMIDAKLNVLKDKNGNPKNLKWLLDPLDNTDQATIENELKDVAAYMVAERTVELGDKFGRESILTGVGGGIFKDVDVAKKALDEYTNGDPDKLARLQEAAARYRELSDDVLKYMVDKGRMSKEQYNDIKANNVQYVALNRVMETEPNREVEVFTGKGGKLGSKTEVIKKIKGSTKTIENPYTSLMNTINKGVKEADRNEVLGAFRDLLVGDRNMREGEVQRLADIGVLGKEGDKNAITIFVDGKPEHWIFQEDIYKALKGLDSEGYKLPAVFTALPRLLRATVTNFPVFAAKNFIRDLQDRMIKSNENSWRNAYGVSDLFGDAKHWEDVARAGGLGAGHYMKDKAHYYGLLGEAMREISKDKKFILADGDALKKGWEGYQSLLSKAETTNRVAEYRAAFRKGKEQGMDDYNAMLYGGFKSADLIDFAVMGDYMKVINQVIPFSNAAVQGLRSTAVRAKENPKAFAARMILLSVLPSMAEWLINHRDDETAKEYEALPAYQRDMFWNFKIGTNKWLSIPKPFELSMPAAGASRALSAATGTEGAFDGYAGSVAKTMMPFDESVIFGPAQSFVEGIANYDAFRDKTIIPPHEQPLALELRNTERASRLGKAIQSVAGIDARKIDHIIKSNASYYGKTALKISDIGRDDKQNEFGMEDLGFFKETPAYNSKPVQKYLKLVQELGLTRSSEYKEFKALSEKYFGAKTDEEKESLAKQLIDFANSETPDMEKVMEYVKEHGEKPEKEKKKPAPRKSVGY